MIPTELKTSQPFSFVLFGASGHLADIKIYPALYVLALKKRVPKEYAIVGFSRTKMSDTEFRAHVEKSIRTHMPAVTETALVEFLTHIYYHSGQYDDVKDYKSLAIKLDDIEMQWEKTQRPKSKIQTVRLAYFSVPPEVFPAIAEHLCAGGVHTSKKPFRVIVEKPVGHNLKSFEEIRTQLTKCFSEEEIYLLDHYLGKEAVRNIYYLRHANPMMERIFKNTLIDHVEITAMESAGLDGRAGYFEASGTFRDMIQSHMLMIVALLTMRLQTEGEVDSGRRNALEQCYLPPVAEMGDVVLQAQYGKGIIGKEHVPAYCGEKGIDKNSRTNTFVAMKLVTRISRWEGVPFYLRSGKRMSKKETRVSILFQEPRQVGKGATPNRLDIILQGEAGMRVHLQTKVGGTEPSFRPLILEDPLVCFGDCLPEHALLILEAVHGKRQWFLNFDEVRTAWRLCDPVQAYLDSKTAPLHTYPAGTNGPEEADKWIAKDGRKWC